MYPSETQGICGVQSNPSMPARDVSPIERMTNQLGQNIEGLHEALSTLHARLTIVSAPQHGSNECCDPDVKSPPKAPLEMRLDELACGVEQARQRIHNILAYLHI